MDLLVKLYALPLPIIRSDRVSLRRAFAGEKQLLVAWVAEQFGTGWASECEAAFARLPVSCFIAVNGGAVRGFACYDATARVFFGPFGVGKIARGRDIGSALLGATLRDMAAQGYAYAIIGDAAEVTWCQKRIGAVEIPDSDPGFYHGM